MNTDEILEKLARPGIYVCVWPGSVAFVETDADGVQHQLNPDTFDRAGVLRRDRWNSVIGTDIYGPFARIAEPHLTRMRNGVQQCSRDGITWVQTHRMQQALASQAEAPEAPDPLDMVLHCPKCGLQHIDAPEPIRMVLKSTGPNTPDFVSPEWTNPPHRSHLCHGCRHVWRPADVPTNGVAAVKTKGKNDSPPARASTPLMEVDSIRREAVRLAARASVPAGEDAAFETFISGLPASVAANIRDSMGRDWVEGKGTESITRNAHRHGWNAARAAAPQAQPSDYVRAPADLGPPGSEVWIRADSDCAQLLPSKGERSIIDPTRSAAADMRRLAALWRFGREVLPTAGVPFEGWLFQLDMLIDSKTHGLPFEECPPLGSAKA